MTIERKTLTLTLLCLVAVAAVTGGFLLMRAANANGTTDSNAIASTLNGDFPPWSNGSMMFGAPGFAGGSRGRFGGGCGPRPGSCGPIEVSTEYEENVTNIAKSDTDVQNLLADGYNITSVRPLIKSTIDANGLVTTKATTAVVLLRKDTSGFASVSVDLEQGKVTKITIVTKTVIEKP